MPMFYHTTGVVKMLLVLPLLLLREVFLWPRVKSQVVYILMKGTSRYTLLTNTALVR